MSDSSDITSFIDSVYNDEFKDIEDLINNLTFEGGRIDVISNVNDKECINNEDEIVIGIDLGTTNSCVSIWRNNHLEIIPDEKNNYTIPSVVSFTNTTKWVGVEARNQSEINPLRTYYEIKRLIGKLFNDPNVQLDKDYLSYKICEGDGGSILIDCEGGKKNKYTPEEISAMILLKLKLMAEEYLKMKITKAVITVPAYFNDTQREATKNAAKIAGLECLRIINEPTAAALAYGFTKKEKQKSTIMIYDLGGGTLDVVIMKLNNNVSQVLSSVGNTHLGGSDFDKYIMDYCINEFKKKHKIQNIQNISSLSFQLLKKRCEYAKKKLSEKKVCTIAVKNFLNDMNLCVILTREIFEKICSTMFIACLEPIEASLNSCNMDKSQIDEVILVGGCTRIPRIKKNIENFFGKPPNDSVNPDIVVSAGAAIQGYILSHPDDPYSTKVTLLDIVPLSLGVETMRSIMTNIIPRNSVIPIKKTKRFYSDEDYQTSLMIKIFEGERKLTKDNYFIGSFELNDIDPRPKELQQILVSINVDFNGIIDVTAIDKNKEDNRQTIRITSKKNMLSQEDVDVMIKEAREWELADKLNNELRMYQYQIKDLCEIILNNLIDNIQLTENDRKNIQSEIEKVLEWLKNKDIKYDDYYSVFNKIQTNYATLILKKNKNLDNIKSNNEIDEVNASKSNGVSIFNNDKEEETIYKQIESEDIFSDKLTDDEKKQILEIRDELNTLCYSVLSILSNDVKIEISHKNEITDLIDDTLLWIHVVERPSIKDYTERLVKINNVTNELLKNYEKIFDDNNTTDKDKEYMSLETLCYALQCNIEDNIIILSQCNKEKLVQHIQSVLDWLFENKNVDIQSYINKKEELNKLCSNMQEDNVTNNNPDILLNNDILLQLDAS